MRVHSLLHRHATSGSVTKRKRVDEPPEQGGCIVGMYALAPLRPGTTIICVPLRWRNGLAATRVSQRVVDL
jgi:hypothetical protein